MDHPTAFALLIESAVLARLAKAAGGGVLGLVVLGWVVEHCGAPNCSAVVHVVESDVELTIGGNAYAIRERRYDPIVCELPAGRHELVMQRGGRVLYRESFELWRGEEVVLTAWDPDRFPGGRPPSRGSGPTTGR